jgi:hypothetical protein
MRFEKFSFGSIRIDGVTYEHDVIIDHGRADSPVLVVLRRVLREARAVAQRGLTTRVRLDLPTRRA